MKRFSHKQLAYLDALGVPFWQEKALPRRDVFQEVDTVNDAPQQVHHDLTSNEASSISPKLQVIAPSQYHAWIERILQVCGFSDIDIFWEESQSLSHQGISKLILGMPSEGLTNQLGIEGARKLFYKEKNSQTCVTYSPRACLDRPHLKKLLWLDIVALKERIYG